MNKKLVAGMAALLTTVLEVGSPMPLGPAYAAMNAAGYTYEEFQGLITMCAACELVHTTSETISLTPKGREAAQGLEEILQKHKD